MNRTTIRTFFAASVLFAFAMGAVPAWADLGSAATAYKKGEFARAFEQFKELAELGQPEAQLDLAIMYARGEGTTISNTHAHAWASLASTNGESRAAALRERLESELTPTSLQISSDIQAQYSQAALDKRLMPRFLKGREYEDRDPVQRSKPFIPSYPGEAQRKGVQGEVYVEFVVAPDGHPRIPRILYAVPVGFFEDGVRDSVMRSIYLPARINGVPIATPVSTFYNFKMDVSIDEYGNLEQRVKNTLKKAEAGDPAAQMLYGMMVAGLLS